MKVISADFTPVVPYDTEVLWIQPGQRYNVIVEANQVSSCFASFWLKLTMDRLVEHTSSVLSRKPAAALHL